MVGCGMKLGWVVAGSRWLTMGWERGVYKYYTYIYINHGMDALGWAGLFTV
jgi:hypothetical protein